jgi:ferritin-like metal-binding protein YciE
MKVKSFEQLFETGLRYAYDCEQKLVKKGIPGMIEAASTSELRNALEQHLNETHQHVARLERVFGIIGAEPKAEDNDIVSEMIDATENMVSATEDGSPLRDAGLIVGGNFVEHYEIAAYGSLINFANQLGHRDAVQILEQTLQEEKAADAKLTELAKNSINASAAQVREAA